MKGVSKFEREKNWAVALTGEKYRNTKAHYNIDGEGEPKEKEEVICLQYDPA